MSQLLGPQTAGGMTLAGPIDAAALDDSPNWDLRAGALVIFLFFGLFLGWAAFSRLDSAAFAPGQVVVAGHRQTIQHREGGKVMGVFVKEGDHVVANQVLITLDPGQVQAEERAIASQVIGLAAQRARLLAERAGAAQLTRPPEFDALSPEELADADQALRMQTIEMQARRRSVATQKGVMGQRSRQLSEQIAGYKDQINETETQSKLMGDELAGTQSLADQGYASTNRLRALQRQVSGLRSQKADLSANAARAAAQIGETQLQSVSIDTQMAEGVAKDLHDVETQLNDLTPKLHELKSQLAATQIRAPSTGQVVALTVSTVGGVVAPGQKVLDIVPDAAPVLVEAQVSPNDVDDLHVGQETEVKITAFHERNLPVLKGILTRVSADSLLEERTGNRYFTADVTVPVEEVNKIMRARGKNEALRPGLPIQVLVPLKKRTALQYMFEPITQALWKTGREH